MELKLVLCQFEFFKIQVFLPFQVNSAQTQFSFRKAIHLYLIGYWALGNLTTSEGFIIGTPTTFSKEGIFFKTYEGKINVNQSQNLIIDDVEKGIWSYSVDKKVEERVLEKIEQAIQDNKRAKFFYKKKFLKSDWSGETKYFVYDVEILD